MDGMTRAANPRPRSGLTSKQEAFALAYCRLMNASDAYREVYQPRKASAKTVNEAASRLAKNSKVAARIASLRATATEVAMLDIERVRTELARLCFSNIHNALDEHGVPKPMREIDSDTRAAIELYEVRETLVDGAVVGRTTKIKFWDKNSALGLAARHLGMFEKDHNQQVDTGMRLVVELVGEPAPPPQIDHTPQQRFSGPRPVTADVEWKD